jgi:hypothetical protein
MKERKPWNGCNSSSQISLQLKVVGKYVEERDGKSNAFVVFVKG